MALPDNKQVQDPPVVEGSVKPDAPPEGVPAQSGMAPQGSQDAVSSEVEQQIATLQKDMSKMRSIYDRQLAEKDRTYQEELSAADKRVDDVLMAGMNEQDKLAYELTRERERTSQIRTQLEQERARSEEITQLASYRQYFTDLGLPSGAVDYTSMESMGETAFPALLEMVRQLRTPTSPPPTQPPVAQQLTTPLATPLVKQTGTQVAGPRTPQELVAQLTKELGYQVTEEDIGKLVRQGRLDASILDSLDPDRMY